MDNVCILHMAQDKSELWKCEIIKQKWERKSRERQREGEREKEYEMCFWHKHESQCYSNTAHISNGLYSMAFIAFYVWKMERTRQTIKLFTCWLFIFCCCCSLSLFSFDSRAIVVQMHTHTHIWTHAHVFIMMVALFCITVVLLIRHQHNRHIPFKIHSKCTLHIWIGYLTDIRFQSLCSFSLYLSLVSSLLTAPDSTCVFWTSCVHCDLFDTHVTLFTPTPIIFWE